MTPWLAALLSIPSEERAGAIPLGPERRKARTLDALVQRLRGWPRAAPCWSCSRTCTGSIRLQELLERVVDGTRDAPVLVLITRRPEALPISFGQANVTALTLSRLSRRQSAKLIAG